jgi:hypothetical protein
MTAVAPALPFVAHFDFAGTLLMVRADGAHWLDMMRRGFGAFEADPPSAAPGFTLDVSGGHESVIPDDLPQVWSGKLNEGGDADYFDHDTRRALLVRDCGTLLINGAARHATARLEQGGERRFLGSPSMMLMDAVLGADRQTLVHGACLNRLSTGGAVLLCAPSGAGKTTTSAALARRGFALQTDDASVVQRRDGRMHAWGFPRALKVHRRTVEMLPWLAPLATRAWNAEDEQGIARDLLASVAGIAPCAPVPLEAFIWIGPRRADATRLVPFAKSDALIGLALDNMTWLPTGIPGHAVAFFAAMAATLSEVPAFRLEASPDLDGLPDVIESALSQAQWGNR